MKTGRELIKVKDSTNKKYMVPPFVYLGNSSTLCMFGAWECPKLGKLLMVVCVHMRKKKTVAQSRRMAVPIDG
jgi:hypothetical protein